MSDKDKKKESPLRLESIKKHSRIIAIISIVLGLILLFKPTATLSFLCILIGIALLVYGGISVITYFWGKEDSGTPVVVMGIVFLVLGLIFVIHPLWLISFIPVIVGIVTIVLAIFNISTAFGLKKYKRPNWKFPMIFGLITLILGIILVIHPLWLVSFIIRIMALIIVYCGIYNLYISVKLKKDLDYLKSMNIKDLDKE